MAIQRPVQGEYNPYFDNYLKLVPEGNFEDLFTAHTDALIAALRSIPAEKADYAYAPGKWTIKQMVQHISDTDRVFSYRALVAARGDLNTSLYSFDENQYADNAVVSIKTLSALIDELKCVRQALYYLVKDLDEKSSTQKVFVAEHPLTAHAMAYISIGHGMHHLSVLRSRYFTS